MAKWGKGDPRWIVEERTDATNVNNWHWTERDATGWSKDLLRSLLTGLSVEEDKGKCNIKEVTEITGEASANNRKGKLFFFYEFVIKMKWSGHVSSKDDCKCTGTLEVLNLSDENELDCIDIVVETKKSSSEAHQLKDLMRNKAIPLVKEQLAAYLNKLRQEFSQGMVLSRQTSSPLSAAVPTATRAAITQLQQPIQSLQLGGHGLKIRTKRFTMTVHFKTTSLDLYHTLTDQERVKAYTDSSAVVQPYKGGKISLYGGNITGEYVSLEINTKIVQRWRAKGWPAEHYSMVTMEIKEQSDDTQLDLLQTEVPEDQLEYTRDGWTRNFFERMKTIFGYSARLL